MANGASLQATTAFERANWFRRSGKLQAFQPPESRVSIQLPDCEKVVPISRVKDVLLSTPRKSSNQRIFANHQIVATLYSALISLLILFVDGSVFPPLPRADLCQRQHMLHALGQWTTRSIYEMCSNSIRLPSSCLSVACFTFLLTAESRQLAQACYAHYS